MSGRGILEFGSGDTRVWGRGILEFLLAESNLYTARLRTPFLQVFFC